MLKNAKWNKYEAAILIDGYNSIADGKISREEVALNISERLRDPVLIVDETYRNVNGITLQLGAIEFLMTNGSHGISHVSNLFRELVELYKERHTAFTKLLEEANLRYPPKNI